VAQKVLDNGLEFVEDKLGMKLKPDMSPEEIQKVSEAAMKHEEFIIEQGYKDVADARDMNEHIQESSSSSTLAKNAAYILDFMIIGSAIVLAFISFFVGVPDGNKELIYTLLGSLWTYSGVVINFHRGTSSSSHKKDDFILKGK
jgi:hypothetical protein